MSNHYETAEHRSDATALESIQEGNARWWTTHTMSYDWGERLNVEQYSLAWFDEIDRRFVRDSRLFAHHDKPFDRLIPFAQLAGKEVLEIGCGMGFHTELFTRAGAQVTSIDISETSVEATRKRLALKGLSANVCLQDAETLPFEDRRFDYVWSWGVIHHSSHTARIVRQISRVLSPSGECCLMVYNRDSASAWRSMIKYHWLYLGALRGRSVDEALNRGTDGFHARHYTVDQLTDLLLGFFQDVETNVCGQVPDALPLPRRLRWLAQRFVSEDWLKRKQQTRGSFLVVHAKTPF